MTPIADMVAQMMAAGVAQDMILLAIRTTEMSACPPDSQVDAAADRRRAWDREYRRNKRVSGGFSGGCPPDTKPALIEEVKEEQTFKKEVKKESKKEPRKKNVHPIPLDWHPPARAFPIAQELGLQVPPIEARFRDYLASKGVRYADYDAAFCNFVRNAPKFNGGPNGQRSRDIRSAGENAVIAGFSKVFGGGDGEPSRPADAEIPRGRVEFDLGPANGSPAVRKPAA